MPVTLEVLRAQQQDYLLARWENNEMVMEPFCGCGKPLEDSYFCSACNRECDCNFIACEDPQSMAIVEKLIQGNPNFRNFKASLLDK